MIADRTYSDEEIAELIEKAIAMGIDDPGLLDLTVEQLEILVRWKM